MCLYGHANKARCCCCCLRMAEIAFPRNLNCRKNVRESIPPQTPATVPPHVLIVFIRLCGYLSRYLFTRALYINRRLPPVLFLFGT